MILSFELSLVLIALLGLGVWGIVSGLRLSAKPQARAITPQELSSLAQPFKNLLGEAVSIYKDVKSQADNSPRAIRKELEDLSFRIGNLTNRALPRARHGTSLAEYLLGLEPNEAQYQTTLAAKQEVENELKEFVENLKIMRGKVYHVLTEATSLQKDSYLSRDLDDALIEISALESAFAELDDELKL